MTRPPSIIVVRPKFARTIITLVADSITPYETRATSLAAAVTAECTRWLVFLPPGLAARAALGFILAWLHGSAITAVEATALIAHLATPTVMAGGYFTSLTRIAVVIPA